ncbi:MAG: hypothetical protein P1U77_20905 [Rubripirellula sp.]|nr:hypothetical protein [Rubripirellula sp.]
MERLQLDPNGINASASWSGAVNVSKRCSPISSLPGNDILVVMQHDRDTQITKQSPWFDSMADFLEFLLPILGDRAIVRKHPRHRISRRAAQSIRKHRSRMCGERSFRDAINNKSAICCINSSAAIEALAHRIPVLCFGSAIYRYPGAVYTLTRDQNEIKSSIAEVDSGSVSLCDEAIQTLMGEIESHQITAETLETQVLERVSAALFANASR